MRIRKKDIGDNLAWALQSLPLFEDVFLGMQAFNLGMVHEFLLEIEGDLLRELLELERTPPNTTFVSAISQLWIFGLYELLRTWRQRADEIENFASKVSQATETNRRNGKGGVELGRGWILALESEATEVIPNESISLCIAGQCSSKRLLFCTSDTLALRLWEEIRAP